jgi:TPR repeat protein
MAREDDPEILCKIGDAYSKNGNYRTAFAWFYEAALQGHSNTQAQVGYMYINWERISPKIMDKL